MKKTIGIVMTAVCVILVLAGCAQNESAEQWDSRPMLMVEGQIYMDTGKQMPVEIEESAILGVIASSVDGSEKPAQDGESNFGCEDAPYAYLNEGLVVLLNNEWVFFEKEE